MQLYALAPSKLNITDCSSNKSIDTKSRKLISFFGAFGSCFGEKVLLIEQKNFLCFQKCSGNDFWDKSNATALKSRFLCPLTLAAWRLRRPILLLQMVRSLQFQFPVRPLAIEKIDVIPDRVFQLFGSVVPVVRKFFPLQDTEKKLRQRHCHAVCPDWTEIVWLQIPEVFCEIQTLCIEFPGRCEKSVLQIDNIHCKIDFCVFLIKNIIGICIRYSCVLSYDMNANLL